MISLLTLALVVGLLATPFALRFSLARPMAPEVALGYVAWVLAWAFVLITLLT
jgi:hypothetical protein